MIEAPYYPIVYVRGYAGTQAEVEETVADPYMGFNLGSTKLRQRWTGEIQRFIFESPLLRLIKEHGYRDVYAEGAEPPPGQPVPARSVWIYRYYEQVSEELGSGVRPEIEDYARGLGALLARIREHTCGADAEARRRFRVYLVAHSMGGLVVRCYLQRIAPQDDDPVAVDKVFTYATPHGGIDFRLIGNVPAFLRVNNADVFNVERIRDYLVLAPEEPVNSLGGHFDARRFFCLIGTAARDYAVAGGLSASAVGPMSDGLVQIKNAYVAGAPRAFVHRAHSGHYGIVNSEEGYQNLARFLLGDVRVEGLLEVDEVTLPPRVAAARRRGRAIRASYHIEVVVRVRRARWDLTRRLADEQSAIFRTYDALRGGAPPHLFTAFLAGWARGRARRSLGFAIDLRVLVPEYEIDGLLLFDEHIEGGYLFRDKLNLEITPAGDDPPLLRYGWDSRTPNRASRRAAAAALAAGWEFRIPVAQRTRPGLRATLVLRAEPWS